MHLFVRNVKIKSVGMLPNVNTSKICNEIHQNKWKKKNNNTQNKQTSNKNHSYEWCIFHFKMHFKNVVHSASFGVVHQNVGFFSSFLNVRMLVGCAQLLHKWLKYSSLKKYRRTIYLPLNIRSNTLFSAQTFQYK